MAERATRRRVSVQLLCGLVALALATPAGASEAEQRALAPGDSELARQIEEARRLQEAAIRRETEAAEARARELEQQRRAVAERDAALRREREERLRHQINSELDAQSEMLERQQRNQATSSRDLLGAHAAPGSASQAESSTVRVAPKTPEIRNLPRAIFSEKSVTIPKRSPGFENDRKLKLTKLMLDADSDGAPEVVRYVERKSEIWIRQEEDRDYDGKMDAFVRFKRGQMVTRELDSNGDGALDIRERYASGRLAERTLDRDNDGVEDAFYKFEGRYLASERHDADNNGEIDLAIQYRDGQRIHSEEDTDRDGRVDTWTRYGLADGKETVVRIESDKTGRGFADTFEVFEAQAGKAVLARREEDLDGDGEVDMVSIYRSGKLVRREILKPEVVPL